MSANPYANTRLAGEDDDLVDEQAAFVARGFAVPGPSTDDAPYLDALGWAPGLRTSPQGTPDSERLGITPIRDFRGTDLESHEDQAGFYERRDADVEQRNSVVDVRSNPLNEVSSIQPNESRFAPNPRSLAVNETRMTSRLIPSRWQFLRPFNQRFAHRFNSLHFSMADHRREYEILGMEPVTKRRNTQRLDPAPWDTDVTDVAAPVTSASARMQAVNPLPTTNGGYRLS